MAIRSARGLLELALGRDADALAAFHAADRLAAVSQVVSGCCTSMLHTLIHSQPRSPALDAGLDGGLQTPGENIVTCASIMGRCPSGTY